MYFYPVNKKKLIVSIVIAGIALVGDKNSENQSNRLAAAICDNVTHGLIGAFTWIGMFVAKTSNVDFHFYAEIFLCGLFSSLIDADHFVAAKSIHLKDATSLSRRPFMHCTSVLLFLMLIVLSLSHFLKINWMYKLGWIFAAAFLSHHIRDSKRRGFWVWPFGSTKPTPTYLYIIMQVLLPHIFSAIMSKITFSESGKEEFPRSIETV